MTGRLSRPSSKPLGIAVQFLVSGERAGSGSEVRLPDPNRPAVVTQIEGLPVLSLARLIETKLACGQGNIRRTHRDFADVVEFIALHGWEATFRGPSTSRCAGLSTTGEGGQGDDERCRYPGLPSGRAGRRASRKRREGFSIVTIVLGGHALGDRDAGPDHAVGADHRLAPRIVALA